MPLAATPVYLSWKESFHWGRIMNITIDYIGNLVIANLGERSLSNLYFPPTAKDEKEDG